MSQTKPMTASQRRTNYENQNGTTKLTGRQERRIRKSELKAEHHRPSIRTRIRRDRARPGRKRALANHLRNHYARSMRDRRRDNRRARPTRATAPKAR